MSEDPLPEDVREALRAGIRKVRPVAQKAGPLHGLWDVIFDAEALLEGKRTLLSWSPPEVARVCLEAFADYERRQTLA
jgi:hypothetical protein